MPTAREIQKKITKVEREITKNDKAIKRLEVRRGKIDSRKTKLDKQIAKLDKPIGKLEAKTNKLETEKLAKLKTQLQAAKDKAAGKKGSKKNPVRRSAKEAPPAPESSENFPEEATGTDEE